MAKKPISETNTGKAEGQIKAAFGMMTGREYFPPQAETVYEHGQWWVVHPPTARVWSVVDTTPGIHHTGLDFDELESSSEDLSGILDIFRRRHPTGEQFRKAYEKAKALREKEKTKRIEARRFVEEQISRGNRKPLASRRFEGDVESVLSLINSLYRAGARRVDVYGVIREPDGNDHADTLLVDFPSSSQARFAMNLARTRVDEANVKGRTLMLRWD
jgi:hypothetical protein